MDTMEQQRKVIIVPIQESLSDDAIEVALSEPMERGYYLAFMLEPRNGNLRAVYKRSTTYVEPAEQAAKDAEDNRARLIMAAHPLLSQVRTAAALSAAGIARGASWIAKQRALMAEKGYVLTCAPQAEGEKAVLVRRGKGNVADKDGMDDAALAFLRANTTASGTAMSKTLAANGIDRSESWVGKRKADIKNENGGLS